MTASVPSTMIEVLTPIWQRLLKRASISPTDDFFDLGGNPALAIALFHEIARVSGCDLPPMLIYQAPTLAKLSALLETPGSPNLATMVPLNSGTCNPPIFFIHGLGGSVMELFALVQNLPQTRRAYGMQLPGVDGRTSKPDTIEALAALYIVSLKSVQTQGPYYLVGYSLGGLIALEIAQQLAEDRNAIGSLVMIDSFPHVTYLPPVQRLRLEAKLALRRIWKILLLTKSTVACPYRPRVHASFAPAWKRYRPRFYNGAITFIKAADHSMFPDNPLSVWAHLAHKVQVESLPGDHLSILTTHAATLAEAVTRHLERTTE